MGHHADVKPITRASLGASPGSPSKTLSGVFCVPVIPVRSWPGKGFSSGEEDAEQWSHFDLAKLEETLNAIVNSKPLLKGWWVDGSECLFSVYGAYAIPSILMPDAFDSDTNHCYELNLQPYN